MATSTPHLVDEFEGAFQNCLSVLTKQEHFNVNDQDEVKTSVEQSIQKYLDTAKQLECFFLQKRMLLSIHKPEQIVKEDINELKQELIRKDQLIQKHYEKLQYWQTMLNRQGQPGSQSQSGTPATQTGPHAQQNQQHSQVQNTQGGQQQGAQPPTAQPMPPQPPQHAGYPQGPLASLEQTTSNIGMPERR